MLLSYYRGERKLNVYIMRSLLRLATKYDASTIRQQVLSELREAFPAKSLADEGLPRDSTTLDAKIVPMSKCSGLSKPEVAILVTNLAEELQLTVVRPCTIWYCAFVLSWRNIIQGLRFELTASLKREVLEARFKILSMFQAVFKQWTGPSGNWSVESCDTMDSCRDAVVELSLAWHDPTEITDHIFHGSWKSPYLAEYQERLCFACDSSLGESYNNALLALWKIAPSFAGFADWAEVLRKAD
jgi:hypothetical protein